MITKYKIIEELLNNPHYKVLDSDEQADAIANAPDDTYPRISSIFSATDPGLTNQLKVLSPM